MILYRNCRLKIISLSAFKAMGVIILMFCQFSSMAQVGSVNKSLSAIIYNHTLHNRFKTADSLIKSSQQLNHYDTHFRIAVINYYWWKYVSTEENDQYAEMIKSLIREYKSQKLLATDPGYFEQLFVLVTLDAFNARLNLSNKSYFNALTSIADYNGNIKASFGKEAKYDSFYLTSGLYYYFFAHASDKIPFFSSFAGNSKRFTKSEGLIYLKKASQHNDLVIRSEARYFLMKIAFEIENDYKTAAYYEKMLCDEFPENMLFRYYKIKILMELGDNEAVNKEITTFRNTIANNHEISEDEKQYFRSLILHDLSKKKTIKKQT